MQEQGKWAAGEVKLLKSKVVPDWPGRHRQTLEASLELDGAMEDLAKGRGRNRINDYVGKGGRGQESRNASGVRKPEQERKRTPPPEPPKEQSPVDLTLTQGAPF